MTDAAVPPPNSLTPNPATEGQPFSLRLFLLLLKRGRRRLLLCGGTGLLVGAALAFSLHNTYVATSSFVPAGSSNNTSALALMGQFSALSGSGLLGGKSQGDLYVGILKSRTIGQHMVDRFNVNEGLQSQKRK